MRRLFATMVALLALCIACEPSSDLGDPSYTGVESVDDVYYFGDSHGALSRDAERGYYNTELPAVTKWDDTIVGGVRLQGWWLAMRNVPAGSTVVVELGWNNILNEAINTGALENNLIGTLDVLRGQGVTRTVWFSLNTASANLLSSQTYQRANWMNARMAELVANGTYDDIGLEIYDWNAIAAPYGMNFLSADKLHHNALGIEAFGCAMYDAVIESPCIENFLL